ncbi:MAG: DUF1801 domain-containing protein [Dehalococcoidia bacterium]|nr:DUF1801 domain-containing protein [Dehalococcoidia bacterium]
MSAADANEHQSAAEFFDRRIAALGDWRGETLSRMRSLIREADPDVVEEVKWVRATSPGTPTWSHGGILCTGETYKSVVKLTFAKGASLEDPAGLFNASLEGNTRRAIDIREGEEVDASAFKALIRAAVALNAGRARGRSAAAGAESGKPAAKPVLLTGGNPQVAKGDGDAPVQAYIAAMPGWKQEVGRRLDSLVVGTVPGVKKAVKWNSPFYGVAGQGWFLSFHVFARYVKVTFFRGTALAPVPPGGTDKDARWIDVHEDDLDEAQMRAWIRRAAALPGWGKS